MRERGLEAASLRQLPLLDTDSSARSLGQLLQLKLPGSAGFEVCTLFIQIAINAFEVGDFLSDLHHLIFNELGAVSTIDQLVALRIQNLAYFPQGKSHALRALDKVQVVQRLRCVIAIVVGPPLR